MRRALVRLAVLAAILLPAVCRAQATEVVTLATRPEITQRMLVMQPDKPLAVLVLMSGGAGNLGIYDNGSMRRDGNFLVRSRSLFVQQGYAVVLPDTPSDRNAPPHLSGSFRESDEHAADIGATIAWARQRFGTRVWLIGTSRGTQSAAHAGVTLAGASAPDGLVLTSAVLAASRFGSSTARPVQEMALEKLRIPVLVGHHEQDQCAVCPPALLPALMAKLNPATSRLITYQGGRSAGSPCEAFAHHGFNGIEDRVVADIAAWIAAQPRQETR